MGGQQSERPLVGVTTTGPVRGQPPIGTGRSQPSNQQSLQVDVHVDGQGASQEAWESASRRSSQTEDDGIQEDVAVGEVAPEVVRQLARSLIQLSGIQPGQLLDVDSGSRHRSGCQRLSIDEPPCQQGDHNNAGENKVLSRRRSPEPQGEGGGHQTEHRKSHRHSNRGSRRVSESKVSDHDAKGSRERGEGRRVTRSRKDTSTESSESSDTSEEDEPASCLLYTSPSPRD